MINIMGSNKCLHIWEIFVQCPDSSVVCTRSIQSNCSSTSSFSSNFVQYLLKFNLEQYSQQAICDIKLQPESTYLSASSIPKINWKVKCTPNCNSITDKENMHQKKENLGDLTAKVAKLNTDDLVPKER